MLLVDTGVCAPRPGCSGSSILSIAAKAFLGELLLMELNLCQ